MEFNENIENEQRPAIAVWGTKRGKQTFFTDNLVDKIDKELTDARTPIQFAITQMDFYSFEQTPKYQCFTAYRTILDWVNRPGYYAVSLLVPAGYVLSGNPLDTLNKMREIYWDKYVENAFAGYRIKDDEHESPYYFIKAINDAQLTLEKKRCAPAGQQKAVFRYSDDDTLKVFFDACLHPTFQPYKAIYLLPETNRLTSSLETLQDIDVHHLGKVYELTIHLYDQDNKQKKPLNEVALKVLKNDQIIFEQKVNPPVVIPLDKSDQDKIMYVAEKDRYQTFNSLNREQWDVADYEEKEEQGTIYLAIPLAITEEEKQRQAQVKQGQERQGPTRDTEDDPDDQIHRQGHIKIANNTHKNLQGKAEDNPTDEVTHKVRNPRVTPQKRNTQIQDKAEQRKEDPESFLQKHKKKLVPAAIATGAALVLIFVILQLGGGSSTPPINWADSTQNLTSAALFQSNWEWNKEDYTTFEMALNQQRRKLSEVPSSDSLNGANYLDSLANQAKVAYKTALQLAINKQIDNPNFSFKNTNKLREPAKYNKLDYEKLEAYWRLTLFVSAADQLIKRGNVGQTIRVDSYSFSPSKLYSGLKNVTRNLVNGKYKFLNPEQKRIVQLYKDVVEFYTTNGNNNPKSLQQFRDYVKQVAGATRLAEIETFLQDRSIL